MISNPTKHEYLFINFYRALAAFWVITSHSMIWGGWQLLPLPDAKFAVDLFMIISGYLMVAQTMYREEYEPIHSKNSWFRFWLRRFFRIAPAYYLSLLLAILTSNYFLSGYQELQNMNPEFWSTTVVYNPARIDYDLKNVLLHVTFLFGLHPQYSFSTFLPDWSLSLEMQFYLVFPFLFLFVSRFTAFKAVLLVGSISVITGWVINKVVFFYEPSFLAFKLQYFLAGMLLYFILNNHSSIVHKISLTFLALFFILIEGRGTTFLIAIIFISMLLLGWLEKTNQTPNNLYKLLNSRLIHFMSESAYSVYLFHGFFISLSGLLISNLTFFTNTSLMTHTIFIYLFVTLCIYPLAYFMFLYIEKPGIAYGKIVMNSLFPIAKQEAINA